MHVLLIQCSVVRADGERAHTRVLLVVSMKVLSTRNINLYVRRWHVQVAGVAFALLWTPVGVAS